MFPPSMISSSPLPESDPGRFGLLLMTEEYPFPLVSCDYQIKLFQNWVLLKMYTFHCLLLFPYGLFFSSFFVCLSVIFSWWRFSGRFVERKGSSSF